MCFAPGPLGRFKTLQPGPRLALKSLQRNETKQLGPRPWGRRGSADSGKAGGAPGRAGARGGEQAHQGTVGAQNLGGRRPTVAHGGDRRGRPRWSQLRRVQCTGSTTHDVRGTRRFYGRRPNDLVARTARTSARQRRHPWQAARQGWGGPARRAQERVVTLNRHSTVTAC
jgi:hypothetical protein